MGPHQDWREKQIKKGDSPYRVNLLSIGGSDPSGGAGVQADSALCAMLGARCLSVVTAVTAQNTSRFASTWPVPPRSVRAQLDSVLEDFEVGAVRIGMVYGAGAIKELARGLKDLDAPIVLDPVLESTTGGALIDGGAVGELKSSLLPLCAAVTPNLAEARALAGGGRTGAELAARRLRGMGAGGVIVTGVPDGGGVADIVLDETGPHMVRGKRIERENHGGGCAHSAMVALSLAAGKTLRQAARAAHRYAYAAASGAEDAGRGAALAGVPAPHRELRAGIRAFASIPGIHRHIPECQTNFAFADAPPRSTGDILAISGRLARVGTGIAMAGHIERGGSKHVASVLLEVARRFPGTRAAANIRYSKATIRRAERAGMQLSSYDRRDEPKGTKARGSSTRWGAAAALRGRTVPPDIIYHTGDWGKEPMIIVLAKDPAQLAAKVAVLARVGPQNKYGTGDPGA